MRRQRSVLCCGPASKGRGSRGRPDRMPQDGVSTTMATPEILPVWLHVDGMIIAKLAVRLVMSTRMLSKDGGD